MYFEFVYKLGSKFRFFPKIKSVDKKLRLIEFPYTSAEIISGTLIYFIFFLLMAFIVNFIFPLGAIVLVFFGSLIAIVAYVFATSIYYTKRIIDFRDEMLQAILEVANYISLNASIEYAVFKTSDNITGTLGRQLRQIKVKIEKKEFKTMGEAFEEYIPMWLEVNPEFVKGLNLLQTASMSLPEVREEIIHEVIDTVIQSYYDSGKKFSEELSHKTKALISMGVMLPMMSLILLPLITIFLPNLLNAALLVFFYNIFFPIVLLVFALNFATNRIQVNTIRIEESPEYTKMPPIMYVLPILIAVILFIPTLVHLVTIDLTTPSSIAREYSLMSMIVVWLSVFGLFLGIEIFTFFYYKKNEKLWEKARAIEEDIPHFLQILASYLSLNRSIEGSLVDIQDDYKKHGFKKHPTVNLIHMIQQELYRSKATIREILEKTLPKISSSMRFVQILRRIVLFTEIDQRNAAKSARMIRTQTLSVYKLDTYIQTLLVETSSLVDISVKAMAPLLSVTAIIMSVAIVSSIEFIRVKISEILIGMQGAALDMQLVDLTSIIPPTVLAVIVGIYFIETALILSVFLSTIKIGTDKFQMTKHISHNLALAFTLYTGLLFLAYYLFTEVVFKGVIT